MLPPHQQSTEVGTKPIDEVSVCLQDTLNEFFVFEFEQQVSQDLECRDPGIAIRRKQQSLELAGEDPRIGS